MGACTSSRRESTSRRRETGRQPSYNGGNTPLKPKKALAEWSHTTPLTKIQLTSMRNQFWDTQPSYSGRIEIWQALRAAAEASNLELAQAIVDSASISVPSGSLEDGAYDELGNLYVIPNYCITDPTNLLREDNNPSSQTKLRFSKSQRVGEDTFIDGSNDTVTPDPSKGSPSRETSSPTKMKVIARLSTNQDVTLNLSPEDTFETIEQGVRSSPQVNGTSITRVRFFFMGKPISPTTILSAAKVGNNSVVQVMIA
ncbi:hypothetical protein SmJEL517_g03090 [Synchytrium microbalum]|uniref:Ubiquitin-like domain-containing protein n=1 Tax=Synchytrium microbalum TaxID=1806994 RepID=A0A507C3W8_9FUNG|nr:uncharacterized protein SmJEL517_g03090 [Synchytrium microbalum]TPX34161.1 hypothetical protein SmJEL517_g03090 [Synchytrium microbalum]